MNKFEQIRGRGTAPMASQVVVISLWTEWQTDNDWKHYLPANWVAVINISVYLRYFFSRPNNSRDYLVIICGGSQNWIRVRWTFEFSRNYTKLTVLSLLYCFVMKGNLISAKCFPPVELNLLHQHLSIFIPTTTDVDNTWISKIN